LQEKKLKNVPGFVVGIKTMCSHIQIILYKLLYK